MPMPAPLMMTVGFVMMWNSRLDGKGRQKGRPRTSHATGGSVCASLDDADLAPLQRQEHRRDEDAAGDDLLDLGGDAEDDETVAEHGDDERANDGVLDAAHASGQ